MEIFSQPPRFTSTRWTIWGLLLLGVCVPLWAAEVAGTRFLGEGAAKAAWRPSASTPPVTVNGGQLLLPCRFSAQVDRVYWDTKIAPLSPADSTLEVVLSCTRPSAIRSLSLHFKSGGGWYSYFQPITQAGLQRIVVPLDRFEAEGKVGKLRAATDLRVSAWKGSTSSADLQVLAIRTRSDTVAIYQATTSEKNSTERRVAEKAAKHVSSLIQDYYISHRMLDDASLSDAALATIKVLILPYNRTPSERAQTTIKRFLGRGGKLIVFHESAPAIAAAMGVQIRPMMSTKKADDWTGMVFTDPRFPARIYQQTWNLIPVTPVNSESRTIAWWENGREVRSREPAIVKCTHGYWFTQIFKDGDDVNKGRTLLTMLGEFDSSVWQRATLSRLETSTRRLGYTSLAGLVSKFRREGKVDERSQQLINYLPKLEERMRNQAERGEFQAAVESAWQLEGQLQRVWSMVQSAPTGEMAGIWDHNGTGLVVNDWDHTFRILKANGINTFFPNVIWGGKAHYPSRYLPKSGTLSQYGDQVGPCISKAKRYGIDIHLWKICWSLDNADTSFRARMKREGRLMQDRAGKTLDWLCPSVAANRKLELDVILEAADRYRPAGMHLDYLRYPGVSACYAPASRKAYEASIGRPCTTWPNPDPTRYNAFRRDQITSFIREVRTALRAKHPSIQLSVAVWPETDRVKNSLGQDYETWLKQDLVDFLCPMSYTEDHAQYQTWLNRHAALPYGRDRIIPGIGVVSNEATLPPDEVLEQIRLGRAMGFKGYALFKLDRAVADQTLPLLGTGAK